MPFSQGKRAAIHEGRRHRAPASGDAMAKVTNFRLTRPTPSSKRRFGDTDRTVIPGVRSLSGSCKLFYYGYTEGGNDKNDCARLLSRIQQNSKYDKITNNPDMGSSNKSKSVVFRLQVTADGSTQKYLDIPAVITGVTMTVSTGEVMQADVTFEANGPALKGSNLNKEDW